jgi:multiple sugar transport system permease protein
MSSTYFKVPKLSNKIVVYLILIFWFIFAIFPIYWAITMSFKDSPHVYGKRPTYMPFVDFKPTVKAWVHLVGKSLPGEDQFIQMPVLGEKMRYMTNSIIVALSSSIITVIFGVMAGYALTRFEYTKWKNDDISFFILSQRMFPPVALAMPFFLLFTWVRLIDKLPSLIIVYAIMNMPIVTWIVKEFFTDVPKELEEAAMVDGATRWKALFRIIIPMAVLERVPDRADTHLQDRKNAAGRHGRPHHFAGAPLLGHRGKLTRDYDTTAHRHCICKQVHHPRTGPRCSEAIAIGPFDFIEKLKE